MTEQRPPVRWPSSPELAVGAILVLAKVWLTRGQSLLAIGNSLGDDRLYLDLASELVRGHWLGPLHYLALAKNPLYPMWVAATFVLDVPLLLAEQLLYVLACALLVAAVAPALRGRIWAWVLFLVLFFNPVSFADQNMTRAAREGIYGSLTLLVFAGCAGCATRLEQPCAVLFRWSCLLGVSLGAIVLCREEGVWITPLVVIAVLAAARRPFPWPRAVGAALLAGSIAASMIGGVLVTNWLHYGVAILNEQNGGAFPKAYGAVSRVRHANWRRFVPVPKETRQRIYAVSPRFAELAPFIEGPDLQAWIAPSCRLAGVCDDVYTGLFLWTMRDAARQAGHFKNGCEAAAFWEGLAREVNDACSEGRLDCLPPRSSLMPPWRSEYMRLFLDALGRGAVYIARFQGVTAQPTPSAGPLWLVDIFRDLSHERLAGLDAQSHVVRVVGWAAAKDGSPLEITLSTEGGGEALSPAERRPRPDVEGYLRSHGVNVQDAGFALRGYCPASCELIVSAAGKELVRVPLERKGVVVDHDKVAVAIDEVFPEHGSPLQERMDAKRIAALEAIIGVYRRFTPLLAWLALVAWIVAGARVLLHHSGLAIWLMAGAALAGFTARLAMLSVVDAMAFNGINVQYLSAAYPLFLAFVALGLASAAEHSHEKPER
jgi:hypothetical protein